MCNAWNHPPGCSCGWGGQGYSGDGGGGGRYIFEGRGDGARYPVEYRIYERSYVNPNAKCPVCGAPVFFYRSPYNGRVYFDELGYPWTKHPCTDASTVKVTIGFTMTPPPVLEVSQTGRGKFLTITQALQQAHYGNTIIVSSGVYRESLVITKPITIIGKGNPIIQCPNYCICVEADFVMLSGFTIQCLAESEEPKIALRVSRGRVVVENCNIYPYEVHLHNSSSRCIFNSCKKGEVKCFNQATTVTNWD